MKERPILFSGSMIRALLAGTKTQTRRLVKPQPHWDAAVSSTRRGPFIWPIGSSGQQCGEPIVKMPYGVPGDRLWCRENLKASVDNRETSTITYEADGAVAPIENSPEGADRWFDLYHYDSKRRAPGSMVPSIHMPRWASRLVLEVTDVRVERLDAISEADALAEGIGPMGQGGFGVYGDKTIWRATAAGAYRDLWEKINGPLGDANPWVFAVSFTRT